MKYLLFFVVIVLLQYVHPSHEYDYMTLSLQWPLSVYWSNPGCISDPPEEFTIHGLWPSNYNLPDPEYCSPHATFSMQVIAHLSADLEAFWPNIRNTGDETFWRFEWDKHGTCSLYNNDLNQYFEGALVSRANAVDLLHALGSAGIVPSNSAMYALTDVKSAIQAAGYRFEVQIVCAVSLPYLLEIRLCMDAAATMFIDCPPNRVWTNCPGVPPSIMLPSK